MESNLMFANHIDGNNFNKGQRQPLSGSLVGEKFQLENEINFNELKYLYENFISGDKDLCIAAKQVSVAMGILKGADFVVDWANDMILDLWGKSKNILGKKITTALPELEGQPFLKLLAYVYSFCKPFRSNETLVQLEHNGALKEFYLNLVFHPLTNEIGRIYAIMVVAVDVTAQVKSREELKEAKESLNLAINAAELGMFDMDMVKGTLFWDQRCRALFGINHQEPVTYEKDFKRSIHPDDRERVLSELAKLFNRSSSNGDYDVEYRTVGVEDQLIRWIRAKGKVYFNENDNPIRFIGSVMDITDKVNSIQAIERADGMLRLIVDSAELGTWQYNIDKKQFVASARVKELFGYKYDEEMTYEDAANQVPPEYREDIINTIRTAIERGESFDVEHPIVGFHDLKLRWVRSTGRMYYDNDGKREQMAGSLQDITERKRIDQRKDDFIGIASHELKSPVTGLKAALQMLDRMKDNPSPMLPNLIEISNKSITKLSNLIDDLLNVSKMTATEVKYNKRLFVMSELLNTCCTDVRLEGKYSLVVEGDKNLMVYADWDRIDQVITNFVNNAVKYAPDSLVIRLIVERYGDLVKISVKDNGPGIPSHKLAFVFDRYYRVDYSGYKHSGLGLGLYICSEIIKGHGGDYGVTSELGHGSAFWFTLPTIKTD